MNEKLTVMLLSCLAAHTHSLSQAWNLAVFGHKGPKSHVKNVLIYYYSSDFWLLKSKSNKVYSETWRILNYLATFKTH